jgi:uncharacterized protein (DUF1778 family)
LSNFDIERDMKKMMAIRIDQDLKKFFQKFAEKENRSLSNFMINAVLGYIKKNHGIDWRKESE